MPFLRDIDCLPVHLRHDTGTMIRFRTSQLKHLPERSSSCSIELPDGAMVSGRFNPNRANPNITGANLVRWIKLWVPEGSTVEAELVQRRGATIRLLISSGGRTSPKFFSDEAARRRLRRLWSEPRPRRRQIYERWERIPGFRDDILAVMGDRCQVRGCEELSGIPTASRGALVDAHHLNHVSAGGTDHPLNVAVLCVAHHQLIHRCRPRSVLESWDTRGARVRAGGETLIIERDVTGLM